MYDFDLPKLRTICEFSRSVNSCKCWIRCTNFQHEILTVKRTKLPQRRLCRRLEEDNFEFVGKVYKSEFCTCNVTVVLIKFAHFRCFRNVVNKCVDDNMINMSYFLAKNHACWVLSRQGQQVYRCSEIRLIVSSTYVSNLDFFPTSV